MPSLINSLTAASVIEACSPSVLRVLLSRSSLVQPRCTFLRLRETSTVSQCLSPALHDGAQTTSRHFWHYLARGPANLPVHGKRDDALEIVGRVRKDQRAPRGFEIDIIDIRVIGRSAESLPFSSGSELTDNRFGDYLDYRPLALRTDRGGTIFRVEAALVEWFRSALRRRRSMRFSRRRLSLRVPRAARTCSLSATLSERNLLPF